MCRHSHSVLMTLGKGSRVFIVFYVYVSMHHKSVYLEDQRDAVLNGLYLFYYQVTLGRVA